MPAAMVNDPIACKFVEVSFDISLTDLETTAYASCFLSGLTELGTGECKAKPKPRLLRT
jgi:hypothetical protein